MKLANGNCRPDDPVLKLFKRAQSAPHQFGPQDAGNDNLEKRAKPKKKRSALDHPRVQEDLDVIMGGSDERKKLQARVLANKEKLVPANGHHGGERAANPVQHPDADPVEHVKGLGVGPNMGGELDLFKSIHRQGRMSAGEFFSK